MQPLIEANGRELEFKVKGNCNDVIRHDTTLGAGWGTSLQDKGVICFTPIILCY
jgi:hypothetical protein